MPDNNEECDREDKEISQGSGQDRRGLETRGEQQRAGSPGEYPESVSEGPRGRGSAPPCRQKPEGLCFCTCWAPAWATHVTTHSSALVRNDLETRISSRGCFSDENQCGVLRIKAE